MEDYLQESDGKAADLVPTISYMALRRARTTIEDFVQSYFSYHDLRVPEDFFRLLDIMIFVEGTIYAMDEENERLAAEGKVEATHVLQGERVLLRVLRRRRLLTPQLEAQLRQGKEYWRMERELCAAMLQHPGGRCTAFQLDDVHVCSSGKSFDYRVLNLLLYALRRRNPDQQLLEFLAVDEALVDIGDDLVDYEDDVLKNSFNIYRGYVHLFAEEAQLKLVERISHLEARHRALLRNLPEAVRMHFHARHSQASAVPGSGDWVFPRAILCEAAFREACAGDTSSSDSEQRTGSAARVASGV
ncbi:hypothetical protein WJX81_007737 [Elliptochloris bilobata]|uniref:Uncharacterized protein n=1 Tax=Elliptochloris bilobata TaxID=381761 RepID=A0AAW1S145_9CHLO